MRDVALNDEEIMVTKWNGSHEKYDPKKVRRTLVRVGASNEVANQVLERIKIELYDGITTSEILDMVFEFLKDYKPSVSFMNDLRSALGEMRPKPDFERYVRDLMESQGYKAKPGGVIQGFCVTHEIDGVLRKNGKTVYLEVKNHADTHTYTPFSVTLVAKAKLDDILKGYENELNDVDFDEVLIVCNTRLTEHARRFAECVGIRHLGWNEPVGSGIEALINETSLYPVTMIRGLSDGEIDTLGSEGIITLSDLVEAEESAMGDKRLLELKRKAKAISHP
jgi:hypothetical protein